MLNFVPLFLFKEPARPRQADSPGPLRLLYDAVRGLLEPRLFFFTISFAGFWLMAYQLFDILPNFIDDWVDSRGAAGALISLFGADPIPTVNGGNLTQEWILNFNALLISVFAFGVGYVTGRLRSLTAIVVGIALAAVAIYALGMSMNGWWTLGAIGLFSLGEMMASPTKLRYLAGIAPPGKEGQYMGYANFTVGIGWSIGSIVAGHLYEYHGDKVNLARRYLVDHAHVAQNTVDAVSKNDLLPFFEKTVGVDAWQTRQLLWDTYEPVLDVVDLHAHRRRVDGGDHRLQPRRHRRRRESRPLVQHPRRLVGPRLPGADLPRLPGRDLLRVLDRPGAQHRVLPADARRLARPDGLVRKPGADRRGISGRGADGRRGGNDGGSRGRNRG